LFKKKSKDVQCFFICKTENPMHLINYRMHYAPYMDIKFIPITDACKTLETWMGLKR
jgi:hypothetical protein